MSNSLQNMQIKKPHPCSQCNKSFSSSHQLAQHSRVHSGEKPYPCSYCERKFKQLSHLQQHTRLHTGERPYKCDCGRSFIQLSNLQQHMKTHENTSGGRKNAFFCQQCGKSFKQQSSLTVHQNKKHSDQANSFNATTVASVTYVCHVCNQMFLDELSFKTHAEIHQATATINSSTPLTLWTCTLCNSFFASEIGLQTHIEQTKNDPKHQKSSQIILDKRKMDNKKDGADGTLNDIIFTTLISNGKTVNEHDQIVSANLLAQNFLTFNQTQCNNSASIKQEIVDDNDQNKSNNVNFTTKTNSNTENTNSFVNGNDPFACQPLS